MIWTHIKNLLYHKFLNKNMKEINSRKEEKNEREYEVED